MGKGASKLDNVQNFHRSGENDVFVYNEMEDQVLMRYIRLWFRSISQGNTFKIPKISLNGAMSEGDEKYLDILEDISNREYHSNIFKYLAILPQVFSNYEFDLVNLDDLGQNYDKNESNAIELDAPNLYLAIGRYFAIGIFIPKIVMLPFVCQPLDVLDSNTWTKFGSVSLCYHNLLPFSTLTFKKSNLQSLQIVLPRTFTVNNVFAHRLPFEISEYVTGFLGSPILSYQTFNCQISGDVHLQIDTGYNSYDCKYSIYSQKSNADINLHINRFTYSDSNLGDTNRINDELKDSWVIGQTRSKPAKWIRISAFFT